MRRTIQDQDRARAGQGLHQRIGRACMQAAGVAAKDGFDLVLSGQHDLGRLPRQPHRKQVAVARVAVIKEAHRLIQPRQQLDRRRKRRTRRQHAVRKPRAYYTRAGEGDDGLGGLLSLQKRELRTGGTS